MKELQWGVLDEKNLFDQKLRCKGQLRWKLTCIHLQSIWHVTATRHPTWKYHFLYNAQIISAWGGLSGFENVQFWASFLLSTLGCLNYTMEIVIVYSLYICSKD